MKTPYILPLVGCLTFAVTPSAISDVTQDKNTKIRSALSAAPPSITNHATIADWPSQEGGEMLTIRQGTNGWTCLPDVPSTPDNDPMCLDEPWLAWADAWMNKKPLKNTRMGFGYMLQNNGPDSNTDPYAKGPTSDNEWMMHGVPHLMILVPDENMLQGLPTNHSKGGPWVMWRNTPYVHIMAPMPLYSPEP